MFRALTEDDVLQPYISDDDFKSSTVLVDDVGYNLYVFDKRYQLLFTTTWPKVVEFNFDWVVPNDKNVVALLLVNKLFSINLDAQRHFNLI